MGWTVRGSNPGGGEIFPVQTGPAAHPASCTAGIGSFPGVKSGRGVTLTPHPLLVLWSWKGRAIPPLPLWAVRPVQSLSACTRVPFTFTYIFRLSSHRIVYNVFNMSTLLVYLLQIRQIKFGHRCVRRIYLGCCNFGSYQSVKQEWARCNVSQTQLNLVYSLTKRHVSAYSEAIIRLFCTSFMGDYVWIDVEISSSAL
jgi:hypothetical protein